MSRLCRADESLLRFKSLTSPADCDPHSRQQRTGRCRQLGTIIAAREQVAVTV